MPKKLSKEPEAPKLDGSTVRIYDILASTLIIPKGEPGEVAREHRGQGEQVASTELAADVEARYVQLGAIKLVETLSPAEWELRQAELRAAAEAEAQAKAAAAPPPASGKPNLTADETKPVDG